MDSNAPERNSKDGRRDGDDSASHLSVEISSPEVLHVDSNQILVLCVYLLISIVCSNLCKRIFILSYVDPIPSCGEA